VVLDTRNPPKLARFYAELLGAEIVYERVGMGRGGIGEQRPNPRRSLRDS
jgi:catechol 2,3-dioxygenase-like lactoylglutathione lyase family enzyme